MFIFTFMCCALTNQLFSKADKTEREEKLLQYLLDREARAIRRPRQPRKVQPSFFDHWEAR